MTGKLSGKVCLVTGATRGIGKGIALQLAENGAKVYITGRTLERAPDSQIGGSLKETASEIDSRGGICVPIQCDHANDDEIKQLFERINVENDGQLDILVNNAFSGIQFVFSNVDVPFWEHPVTSWDSVNRVGLRNHFICASYAAKLMVPRKQGLIVNISSGGGLVYLFGALYGIGKTACDRMAADCGFELKDQNVAFVSLWPGYILTENIETFIPEEGSNLNERHVNEFKVGESVEFPGRCIVSLATDPNLMKKTGRILFTYDLAREYGLKDKQGHAPTNVRQLKFNLKRWGYTRFASIIPGFIKVPKWMMAAAEHHF